MHKNADTGKIVSTILYCEHITKQTVIACYVIVLEFEYLRKQTYLLVIYIISVLFWIPGYRNDFKCRRPGYRA